MYFPSWVFTGFTYAAALLPWHIATGTYSDLFIRCLLLAFTVGMWSNLIGKAWIEEWGRGALIIVTLGFLL